MEMIKNYNGQRESVWTSVGEYLRNEPILAEAGENWTSSTLFPVYSAWELWVQCIHTGSAAEFLVAIANETSSFATAILMKGASWEIKSIMMASAVIAGELFKERNFRERRSILMDIGKASYKVLNELNTKKIFDDGTDHLRVSIEFDPYQPLLDVDWIEDIMESVKD
jgi:hypothetical protein